MVTVQALLIWASSKKNGPYSRLQFMPHQIVTFGECRGFSNTTIGFLRLHIRLLMRLHIDNLKIAIREALALIDQGTLSAVTAILKNVLSCVFNIEEVILNIHCNLNKTWSYTLSCGFYFIFLRLTIYCLNSIFRSFSGHSLR